MPLIAASLPYRRSARRPPSALVHAFPQHYGFVRLPAVVHRGCTFIFGHADRAFGARPTTEPPGFRAENFGTSIGSTTARSPHASRCSDACGIAFRPQSQGPRRVRTRAISRFNTQPAPAPVQRLPQVLADKQPRLGGPVWIATPSLQETCTL